MAFIKQRTVNSLTSDFNTGPMKKILLSGLIVFWFTQGMAQYSVSLKMNLEKNKVYRLQSVSEQTVSQTVNGNQQNVDLKVDYSLSVKMIDATADFIVTEIHFDTLMTNTNSMGKIVSISSAVEGDIKSSETSGVLSCIMNRLSKSALYVKMDFTGKPIEIINSKMLPSLILKDTGSITLTGPVSVAVKTQIANMINDNNLKTMIGGFTWRLPDKQVSPGDEWNITQQIGSGGMDLEIITRYHLIGIQGNKANISSESNIRAAANAAPIQSGGATIVYDNLKGMSKSTMVIDSRTGLIIEEDAKSHIFGSLAISAPGVNMQMPMDINGESRIRSLQ